LRPREADERSALGRRSPAPPPTTSAHGEPRESPCDSISLRRGEPFGADGPPHEKLLGKDDLGVQPCTNYASGDELSRHPYLIVGTRLPPRLGADEARCCAEATEKRGTRAPFGTRVPRSYGSNLSRCRCRARAHSVGQVSCACSKDEGRRIPPCLKQDGGLAGRALKSSEDTVQPSERRPVSITALHRGGTSLLHRILGTHPGVSRFQSTGVPEG
jgi:hypothetical protein